MGVTGGSTVSGSTAASGTALLQQGHRLLVLVQRLVLLLQLQLQQLQQQQQLLEAQDVMTTRGPRKGTSATRSSQRSRLTILLPKLLANLWEQVPTWRLLRPRRSKQSSTPSGRTLATMMPTLGLAWTIVVQRQVPAMTALMELSLSQTAQFLASLLVLLPTKMWFGTATMTSRMASLWLMKQRSKSKIVSRSTRL